MSKLAFEIKKIYDIDTSVIFLLHQIVIYILIFSRHLVESNKLKHDGIRSFTSYSYLPALSLDQLFHIILIYHSSVCKFSGDFILQDLIIGYKKTSEQANKIKYCSRC